VRPQRPSAWTTRRRALADSLVDGHSAQWLGCGWSLCPTVRVAVQQSGWRSNSQGGGPPGVLVVRQSRPPDGPGRRHDRQWMSVRSLGCPTHPGPHLRDVRCPNNPVTSYIYIVNEKCTPRLEDEMQGSLKTCLRKRTLTYSHCSFPVDEISGAGEKMAR
jgi:hypothetical protein